MIGKQIEDIINGDAAIVAIIAGRLYPLSSNAQGLPSVYYHVSVTPGYNNNGQQMQDWNVKILTMCKTYSSAWDLSKLIQDAFHKKRRRKVGGITFQECRCLHITDDYEFNISSFGQILEFRIKTSNIV